MGWFNRSEEEERLMKAPLSGYTPILPWNQDANIMFNKRREAKAREIREREADALRAVREANTTLVEERPGYDPASGMTVSEYNSYYDKRFPDGDPGMVVPTVWDKKYEARSPVMEKIRANMLALPESGTVVIPMDAPLASKDQPFVSIHQDSDAKAAGVVPEDSTVYDTSKTYFDPNTGRFNIVF